jgi:MarR-like DNA-binding transcriptional regulator SgrR of sgrS sRNA
MNNKKKLETYELLFKYFGPGESETTLADVAAALGCTSRHARTLLQQMSALEWLVWQPEPGRGKRSLLVCNQEPINACYQMMGDALEAGKHESVFKLAGFNDRHVSSELKKYLISSTQHDSQAIRIPFHREIKTLHPHYAFDRTERHLILHVFQRLTEDDFGEIKPSLAHHWESDEEGMNWTFYLQSGVQYQDQTPMKVDDIVISLQVLINNPYWRSLYEHIESIDVLSPESIRISLSRPDWHLAALLGRSEASIMPSQYGRLIINPEAPVGSGSFMIDIASSRLFRLKRNNNYSGKSALIENIELWIHPDWAKDKLCSEGSFFLDQPEQTYITTCNDVGYFYMMIKKPQLRDRIVSKAIIDVLQEKRLILGEIHYPITFSYDDNNECRYYAQLLDQALANHQHVTSTCVSFGEQPKEADISLGGIRIEGCSLTSLLAFFYTYSLWSQILSQPLYQKLLALLHQAQATQDKQQAEGVLRSILTWLSDDRILTMIRQESFKLTAPLKIQGIRVNNVGWCDFSKLWVKSH